MASAVSKFVAYLRVSTARQGRSGLGLDAQREAVQQFVRSRHGRIIAPEFIEVESGKNNARPELHKAIKRCRVTGATLVVAKLDRLSRNAAFLLTLRDSDVQFVAADLPEANTMTVGVMAVVAQHEREAISTRTKAALAAAKARGTKLGGHRPGAADISQYQRQGVQAARARAEAKLADVADELRRLRDERDEDGNGLSLYAMADRLNGEGILTSRGCAWTATAVRRALLRL
jgi:DNA invertase Pin-like site-specific DNA recombinase